MQTEPGWRDVTVKVENIGRKLFAADGMLSELQNKIKALMTSPDRGPEDYIRDDEERVTIPVRWLERALRPGGGYHEGGDKNLKAVVLGCTITLLSAFVIGAWKLSNDQAAFVAQVTEWQKSIERRIDALERRP